MGDPSPSTNSDGTTRATTSIDLNDIDSRVSLGEISPLNDETGTNTTAVADDEREEYLKRENELADQLAEKESEILQKNQLISSLTEELTFLRNRDAALTAENQSLQSEMNDLKIKFEKLMWENKESVILVDTLKERNLELTTDLEKIQVWIFVLALEFC